MTDSTEGSSADADTESPPADADGASSSKSGEIDISDTVAPSVGPHTTFEKDSPEERLGRHEQSDTDAMGLDKRRSVVGGSYSPSFARQATLYGIFMVVIIALGIGFKVLADKLDEPPKHISNTAPWAQDNAPQTPPANPDLGPTNGPVKTQ
ncbi:MAG: hypothetical protein ACJ77Y_02600 [Chloroflexota bacterium]